MRFVRLAKSPNRHAYNDLDDSLGLARVTSDSYSLADMQSGAGANNLAFVEYDLALINADHGSQLIVEKLLAVAFDVYNGVSHPYRSCPDQVNCSNFST